ncbi:hypothetical protein [Aerococcus viridans]|uniref:hypothetical protein n=1 Tax=Aerococcus viridans TaxID=1377 RepID=UPI003B21C61A
MSEVEVVKVRAMHSPYVYAKDIKVLINQKNVSNFLRDFREFVDENPSYFSPYRGYHKRSGKDSLYDVIPILWFNENKEFATAGSRTVTFKQDLPRLKEILDIQTYLVQEV